MDFGKSLTGDGGCSCSAQKEKDSLGSQSVELAMPMVDLKINPLGHLQCAGRPVGVEPIGEFAWDGLARTPTSKKRMLTPRK